MRARILHPRRPATFARSGRYGWITEVGFIASFYLAYEMLRAFRHTAPTVAITRGRGIARTEAWLHLDVERSANAFVTAHTGLADAAGYYYATLHFSVTPVALAWLWWRHRDRYQRWRNVLTVATVAGLITYWALPVAPPRLALAGLTDTLAARNIFGAANPHGVTGLVNVYAAMPSLHVGWAFWVALAVFTTSTRRRLRWLAWLYPAATTAAVVATANHFLADAAAGIVLVMLSWLAVAARPP